MRIRAAVLDDAAALAMIHSACFGGAAWPADEIGSWLSAPGGFGLVVDDGPRGGGIDGLILCRALGDEAEVLTLAVAPGRRRAGLGGGLLSAAADWAQSLGVEALFLEVAADNPAAVSLYQAAGFQQVGLRRGYYVQGRPAPIDALVYRRALNRRTA